MMAHVIGHARNQLADEFGLRDAEALQDVFGLGIHLSGARRAAVGQALEAFQLRIGYGRNDGVGVRVSVAQDICYFFVAH
jgi:hypothetical protein